MRNWFKRKPKAVEWKKVPQEWREPERIPVPHSITDADRLRDFAARLEGFADALMSEPDWIELNLPKALTALQVADMYRKRARRVEMEDSHA